MSDKGSAFDLHALSETVEEAIGQKIGGMVIAHIDPINMDHPQYQAIEREINEIISKDRRISSFHDLRIIGGALDKCSAVFDIVLEKDADEQDRYDIVRSVRERVAKEFPGMKTAIRVDPSFVYSVKDQKALYPEREGGHDSQTASH